MTPFWVFTQLAFEVLRVRCTRSMQTIQRCSIVGMAWTSSSLSTLIYENTCGTADYMLMPDTNYVLICRNPPYNT